MTKIRLAALAAVALTATTLAMPALASAAPAADPGGGLAPVEFNTGENLNFFEFREINFQCSHYNGGKYPYVAYDKYGEPNITYFTGDGTHIGHYAGEFGVAGHSTVGERGPATWATATVSPHHGTVTFFCANTEQAAHQKP